MIDDLGFCRGLASYSQGLAVLTGYGGSPKITKRLILGLNLHRFLSKIAVGNNIGGIRSRTMRYVLTAVLAIAATACQARTIYVNASGTGDYPTIRAAVNDSNTGDIIILLPGTYTGVSNRNIDSNGKSITVQSTDPCDPAVVAATVIDCQGMGRGFNFVKGESSLLAGFTIINGYSPSYYYPFDEYGDAIYSKNSSLMIFNCVIKKCGNIFGFSNSSTIACDYSSIKLSEMVPVRMRMGDARLERLLWRLMQTPIRIP